MYLLQASVSAANMRVSMIQRLSRALQGNAPAACAALSTGIVVGHAYTETSGSKHAPYVAYPLKVSALHDGAAPRVVHMLSYVCYYLNPVCFLCKLTVENPI